MLHGFSNSVQCHTPELLIVLNVQSRSSQCLPQRFFTGVSEDTLQIEHRRRHINRPMVASATAHDPIDSDQVVSVSRTHSFPGQAFDPLPQGKAAVMYTHRHFIR
ncbi:hypothetical protein D3C76_1445720 [compost metagenome]